MLITRIDDKIVFHVQMYLFAIHIVLACCYPSGERRHSYFMKYGSWNFSLQVIIIRKKHCNYGKYSDVYNNDTKMVGVFN